MGKWVSDVIVAWVKRVSDVTVTWVKGLVALVKELVTS